MAKSLAQLLMYIQTKLPSGNIPRIPAEDHRDVENAMAEYATCIISVSGLAGVVITDSRMENRNVGAVMINDISKNTGFLKTLASDTLTFTDGTEISTGDKITLFFT